MSGVAHSTAQAAGSLRHEREGTVPPRSRAVTSGLLLLPSEARRPLAVSRPPTITRSGVPSPWRASCPARCGRARADHLQARGGPPPWPGGGATGCRLARGQGGSEDVHVNGGRLARASWRRDHVWPPALPSTVPSSPSCHLNGCGPLTASKNSAKSSCSHDRFLLAGQPDVRDVRSLRHVEGDEQAATEMPACPIAAIVRGPARSQ